MTETGRIEEVTQGLVRAVAAAIEDLHLTEEELHAGLAFLTRVGKADELELLSDVLHFSVLVDRITHGQAGDALPSNVQGPFYKAGAPLLDPPYMLAPADEPGDVLYVQGRVSAADGSPVPDAILDVWQANAEGVYDNQDPSLGEFNLRGRMRAGDDGTFEFRTIKPPSYEIPTGGPVGELMRALGRDATRPAHLHIKVDADGYRPFTSMIYFAGDESLADDPIDSVKPGSVVAVEWHEETAEIEAQGLDRPFATCRFDLVLDTDPALIP
jgi:catechol 1,2-dioxygenase